MFEPHEQSTIMEIGAEGCYLLCDKRIAELETGKELNPVEVYRTGLEKGWVRSDCLMLNAEALLGYLTGYKWDKVKTAPGDIALRLFPSGTIVYVIAEYVKKSPSKTSTHFVMVQHDGTQWQIAYNPLALDMSGWTLNSLRIFTRPANG